MSLDIAIIPTRETFISWGEIRRHWKQSSDPSLNDLLKICEVVEIVSKRVLGDDEVLSPGKTYFLKLSVENTLLCNVLLNDDFLDPGDYLEDYGRNLSKELILSISQRWEEIGFYYEITTMAGRSRYEAKLLVDLASTLGELSKGYVLVMNNGIFDVPVGAYEPAMFRKAEPQF